MWETIVIAVLNAFVFLVEIACIPIWIFFSLLNEFDLDVDRDLSWVFTAIALVAALPMTFYKVVKRVREVRREGFKWEDMVYYDMIAYTLGIFFWFIFRPTVWFYVAIFAVINFATDKISAGVTYAISRTLWWLREKWNNIKQQRKKYEKKKPTPIKIIP